MDSFSDYVAGGELFTHLYQREHFTEDEVRIYIGEIILALERLHSVSFDNYLFEWSIVIYILYICYIQISLIIVENRI
jgi:serine/threonine protein kinase